VDLTFGRATTAAEIAEVQALRYTVYVAEMDRYHDVDGAGDQRFAEPEDERSWLFYARDGDRIVAATRLTLGDHGFTDRQLAQYQLQPFLDELPAEVMGVGERATVLPEYRGSGALDQLLAFGIPQIVERGVHIVFGCCEPHLLSLYLRMGQRTYAQHNINSPAAGYLIPLVSFIPDVEALRGVGAATAPGELPACIQTLLRRGSSVRAEILDRPDDYWSEVRHTLDELDAQQLSIFDHLTDDEIHRCIERSTIIECEAGDRVLKRGGTARNIFVVLDGMLEVRDGETIVSVIRPGDVFGEMAFLLERPRTLDVDAAADGTRILSLSEGAVRSMIEHDPTMAAKLLLNLAKCLCVKLIVTH
jgi:CRP-like cAMP-binding protein